MVAKIIGTPRCLSRIVCKLKLENAEPPVYVDERTLVGHCVRSCRKLSDVVVTVLDRA